MPTFPTYHGELPECLNPLKPRHWFLLLYWIYFRPTALKCYMYQADPKLYRTGWGLHIFRSLRIPAYRNLYLTALIATLVLSFVLGFLYTAFTGWMLEEAVNWTEWGYELLKGVTGGVAGGVAGGVGMIARGGNSSHFLSFPVWSCAF